MRLPGGERISTDRSGSEDPGSAWWPLPQEYPITSPLGWRTDPLTGEASWHGGTDIAAPQLCASISDLHWAAAENHRIFTLSPDLQSKEKKSDNTDSRLSGFHAYDFFASDLPANQSNPYDTGPLFHLDTEFIAIEAALRNPFPIFIPSLGDRDTEGD